MINISILRVVVGPRPFLTEACDVSVGFLAAPTYVLITILPLWLSSHLIEGF